MAVWIVLVSCMFFSVVEECFGHSSTNRPVMSVKKQQDNCILSNGLVSIHLDSNRNYVCTALFRQDKPDKSLVSNIQMVGDLEHKVNGEWKGFFESDANPVSQELKRTDDLLCLTVQWQNEYFQATKKIELPAGQPFVRIRYSCYVYRKIPLRVLAAPMCQFPAWMNRYYYRNRSDKILEFDRMGKNGRILTQEPGRWYASGNGAEGVVIALSGLKRDYRLFSWPPEFFMGRSLLRNVDISSGGIAFPHKVAYNAIGDDVFTADIVIGPYEGNPQDAVDKMLKVYPADSITFENIPGNKSAKLACDDGGIKVWADYTHSHHLQKENLSAKSVLDKPFELAGARNQRVGMQLIVRPKDETELADVRIEGIPFAGEVRLMRYVKLAQASAVFPLRDSSQYPVSWPDPLVPFKPVVCSPDSNQGMLISFVVPPQAESRTYAGKVKLSFSGGAEIVIPVSLRVFDFDLPSPRSYQNKSDLNMFMVKYKSHEKGEDTDIQMKYAQMLTDYNLSPQDTVHGWKASVTSALSGKWTTVSLPRESTMIVFEGTFTPHKDEKTKKTIQYPQCGMSRDEYEKFLVGLYRRNIDAIRRKGVKGPIYAIATDGPLLNPQVREIVFSVIKKVRQIDPEIRIIGCVKNNFDSEIAKAFDVVVMTVELDSKTRQAVNQALRDGIIEARWTYVNQWCSIDSPPAALRTIYWEQFFQNISGCWNWGALGSAWSKQKDLYQPHVEGWVGSCWGLAYLIYPPESAADSGPVPSLRLFQIMAGIDDYEYLTIWRSFKSNNAKFDKDVLEEQLKAVSSLTALPENFDKISPDQLEKLRVLVGQDIERMKKQTK